MSEPIVAQRAPYRANLEPGTYWWCRCGRSARQPFCDGSHQGTGISPVRLEVADAREAWLCGCKRTANAPYCDGTHKALPEDG